MRRLQRIMIGIMAFMLFMLPLLEHMGGTVYAAGRGIVVTVAGTGAVGSSGDGGLATSAQLNDPKKVVFDSAGNMYISDQAEHRVRRIDALTGVISTVAGTGVFGHSGDGGPAISAQLANPHALVFDGSGDLYIGGGGTVRKIDMSTGIISTVAGISSGYQYNPGDGGPALSAGIAFIQGLAFDSAGDLYISSSEGRIRKVDMATGIISTVAGNGTSDFSGDGGAATDAQLKVPAGIAIDGSDNLYIADSFNNRIRKVDTSGIISTVAGGGYQGDGSQAVLASLGMPSDVAVDSDGNLLIAATGDSRIRKVDMATGIISSVAGDGRTGYYGDGGPAGSAALRFPEGLAIDSNGYLHIADTYNHVVRRVGPSNNADLYSLNLSEGVLSPAFSSSTTNYTVFMNDSISSVTVTPSVSDSYAAVTVNGESVNSGSASNAISLSLGDAITIVVTAEDGTTKTYTVTRTLLGSNADLSGLALSSGSLSPAFASETISYTADVGNAISSVTVTPTTSDGNATVEVNGTAVPSGSASGVISLNVGSNTITIKGTAQDGATTKTYTVTVTRAYSSNADLSGLTLSSGSLSPAFASGTVSYTADVGNAISSVTVTPTTSDGNATVEVNGTAVPSGSASGIISLNEGDNTITIKGTAQDGATTKTYTVTVTRAYSSNADLSGLMLSSGSLSPAFASETISYTADVDNAISSVTVTPTTSDGNATVEVNGTAVPSGSASGVISLNVGSNTITIKGTAQDGVTTKTYTVTVTRAYSSNADLSGLTLSSGSLSPSFASETISYTADVGNAISSVTVTPTTSDGNATVEVNGTAVPSGSASGVISLNAGSNTITIKGTAQDGATTKTYTVTVTRAAAPVVNEVINTSDEANKSGDASLSGLTLSRGSLSPAFSAGVMSYMAGVDNSVSSITITPTARDSSATVKINGIIVPSGAASGAIALQAGDNRISIEVTAEDGTTMQYIVKITRDSAIIPEPEPAVKGPLLNSNMTNVNQLKKSIQTKLAANPPKPFSDMAKDGWSFKAVTVAQQLGIVAGKPDTSFHGADPVTRAEFAVMVANALDLEAKGDAAEVFIDTKGHWAESKIGALKNIGAIQGDGSGAFMPEALISRAEISAILARLMVFDEQSGPAYFSDTSSSWANDYISQLADTAIVRGMGNGRFFPNNYATREQSVVMILRMLTVCRNVDLQLIDLSM